ncbi:MAG: sortase [Acidimicrobiales bacterium]
MTTLIDSPEVPDLPDDEPLPKPVAVERDQAVDETEGPPGVPMSRRRLAFFAGAWVLMVLVCLTLVLYKLEPLFVEQTQDQLLASYRTKISNAANEGNGLPGISVATKAPESGAPVAILEIGALRLRQVVVEGSTPSQTQKGPGHVVGTAGPGQPGNSVVLARRAMFGGPFADLTRLQQGDEILVTTTQGQSVYEVDTVDTRTVVAPALTSTANSSLTGLTATGGTAGAVADSTIDTETLFGPSDDDRLTLVTSDSAAPWSSTRAVVVVAKLDGKPFPPTPQGGRTDSQTGLSGDPSARAAVALALLGLGASAAAAIFLYRRSSARAAYLLTTPPLIVFVVLLAEAGSRLLPAWS